ncbi:hypothetical protein LQU92_08115 [Kocuria sp. LUK]|uniref:hypothetical protein n=1 Tax=Kocuria sp. LUK TaxID=2897828 RepID=UPI001E39AFD4|nr:hypothetical protein [Kocuria sp. LUK]MCD1145199.1 hypothetical protein [Kocuria sp. LUK]
MARSFNPPPAWPRPPRGWTPPPGWEPDPSWGPAPPGWQFWTDDGAPVPHGAGSWSAPAAGVHGVPAAPGSGPAGPGAAGPGPGGGPGARGRRPGRLPLVLGAAGLLVLGAGGAAVVGALAGDRDEVAAGSGWAAPADPAGRAPAAPEVPGNAIEIGAPPPVEILRGEGGERFDLPRPDGTDRPVLASTLRAGSGYVWFEGHDEDGELSEVTPVPEPGQEAVFLVDDSWDSARTERMEAQAEDGEAWEFRVHDLEDLPAVDEVRAVTGTGARVFRWRAGQAHVLASSSGESNFVVTTRPVRPDDEHHGDLLVNEIGAVERATTLPDADVWVAVEADGPWAIVPQAGGGRG